jgi:hypothetical protein
MAGIGDEQFRSAVFQAHEQAHQQHATVLAEQQAVEAEDQQLQEQVLRLAAISAEVAIAATNNPRLQHERVDVFTREERSVLGKFLNINGTHHDVYAGSGWIIKASDGPKLSMSAPALNRERALGLVLRDDGILYCYLDWSSSKKPKRFILLDPLNDLGGRLVTSRVVEPSFEHLARFVATYDL